MYCLCFLEKERPHLYFKRLIILYYIIWYCTYIYDNNHLLRYGNTRDRWACDVAGLNCLSILCFFKTGPVFQASNVFIFRIHPHFCSFVRISSLFVWRVFEMYNSLICCRCKEYCSALKDLHLWVWMWLRYVPHTMSQRSPASLLHRSSLSISAS